MNVNFRSERKRIVINDEFKYDMWRLFKHKNASNDKINAKHIVDHILHLHFHVIRHLKAEYLVRRNKNLCAVQCSMIQIFSLRMAISLNILNLVIFVQGFREMRFDDNAQRHASILWINQFMPCNLFYPTHWPLAKLYECACFGTEAKNYKRNKKENWWNKWKEGTNTAKWETSTNI